MASFPGKITDGVGVYEAKTWNLLRQFLDERIDFDFVVWRGQRRESWNLDSTLDRLVARSKPKDPNLFAEKHLESFRYACRGRRGPFPKELSEDEWWSLGQHFGLDTPLLDWTASPFVGLFFAFAKPTESPAERRMLFGLKSGLLAERIRELQKKGSTQDAFADVRPKTDENPRLVSQNGLFTKIPIGMELESLVRRSFAGKHSNPILYKIAIPDVERTKILKALNRMNINYLSLFPDLFGASLHCNLRSEIPKY